MIESYGETSVHQTTRTSVFVGLCYAVAVIIVLEILVALYDRASFSTFANLSIVSALLSFIVFSNQRYFTIDDTAKTVHRPSTIVKLWLTLFVIVVVLNYFTKSIQDFSRVVMMLWLIITPLLLILTSMFCRYVIYKLYRSKDLVRTAVFIGMNGESSLLASRLQQAKIMGIDCVGYFDDEQKEDVHGLNYIGQLEDAETWIQQHHIDIAFISMANAHQSAFLRLINKLHDTVTSLYFIPNPILFELKQVHQSEIAGIPVFVAYETPFIGIALLIKRCFDIVFSFLVLLILSPLFLILSIGVKLSSPGPVFFKQKRYGIGGVDIDVYKFRSMYDGSTNHANEHIQATKNDKRITKFGNFLRKTSLDELPQFWNVLNGTMSIVGPRPHPIQLNEVFRPQIKGYMMRYKVKPGITGWAQVNGYRGETDTLEKMEKRVEYDIYYIQHWSLKLDMQIILRTVLLVFKDNHAY